MVKLIVARSRDGCIGNEGVLPWHIREDLSFFKQQTFGHTIIMGRKTWEGIGKSLPKRINLVVSKSGLSIEQAIKVAEWNKTDAYICGGAEVYNYCLDEGLVDEIVCTNVDLSVKGDTYIKLPNWPIYKSEQLCDIARAYFMRKARKV